MKSISLRNLIIVISCVIVVCLSFVVIKLVYQDKENSGNQQEMQEIIDEIRETTYTEDGITYLLDKDTGEVRGYFNGDADRENVAKDITIDEAWVVAYDEAYNFASSFFDYQYEYEVQDRKDFDYSFYIYQLTEKGNRTGNSIHVKMLRDGTIVTLSIFNHGDASIADEEVLISEIDAKAIAFEAIRDKSIEICKEYNDAYYNDSDENKKETDDEPMYNDQGELIEDVQKEFVPLEIYIGDIDDYSFEITKSVFKGRHCYFMTVEFFNSNEYIDGDTRNNKYSFTVHMDANTGEVILVGYGTTYIYD